MKLKDLVNELSRRDELNDNFYPITDYDRKEAYTEYYRMKYWSKPSVIALVFGVGFVFGSGITILILLP